MRLSSLWLTQPRRRIRRAIFVKIAGPAKGHIDIGIASSRVVVTRANRDEHAIGVAAVLQMMAVFNPRSPGRNIANAQYRFALILNQHRFARQHDEQFILTFMPVALR